MNKHKKGNSEFPKEIQAKLKSYGIGRIMEALELSRSAFYRYKAEGRIPVRVLRAMCDKVGLNWCKIMFGERRGDLSIDPVKLCKLMDRLRDYMDIDKMSSEHIAIIVALLYDNPDADIDAVLEENNIPKPKP